MIKTFFIIIGIILANVVYQSRNEPFSLSLYLKRFKNTLLIIYIYARDVGMYGATRFREIDWNLDK